MKKSLFDLPKFEGRVLRHDLAVWRKFEEGSAFRVAWLEKAQNVGYFLKTQGDPSSPMKVVGRYQYIDEAEKRLAKIYRKLKKDLA